MREESLATTRSFDAVATSPTMPTTLIHGHARRTHPGAHGRHGQQIKRANEQAHEQARRHQHLTPTPTHTHGTVQQQAHAPWMTRRTPHVTRSQHTRSHNGSDTSNRGRGCNISTMTDRDPISRAPRVTRARRASLARMPPPPHFGRTCSEHSRPLCASQHSRGVFCPGSPFQARVNGDLRGRPIARSSSGRTHRSFSLRSATYLRH